jgi:hypothetical protein
VLLDVAEFFTTKTENWSALADDFRTFLLIGDGAEFTSQQFAL